MNSTCGPIATFDCETDRTRSSCDSTTREYNMKHILFALVGLITPLTVIAVTADAQAARKYDCSKAGNATKAVCKSAAIAAAPVTAAKPASTRNYDCSKAGNATKAVCKTAVVGAPAMPTAAKPRNYDCSKAGNSNKAVCKGAIATAAPAPAARVAPAPATISRPSAVGQNTNPGGPGGATAKCRDGTMSSSAHRSGTCSRHGGVAQFY